jgi:uncharacterized protein
MRRKIVQLLSCICVLFSTLLSAVFVLNPKLALAYASPGKPTGYVNDFANIIDDQRQVVIEQDLQSFRDTTSNEISVVTIQSLGGDNKENFALELAREWGIGGAVNRNGVLVLVAVDERQIRIEVSQQLEGAITDLASARIASNDMAPLFKKGDYAGGIEAGLVNLKLAAQGEYNTPASSAPKTDIGEGLGGLLFFGFFVLAWLSSFFARSKSIVAGGVVGGITGVTGALLLQNSVAKVASIVLGPAIGLFLDWLVSKNYRKNIDRGGKGDFPSIWGGFSGGSGGSGGGGGFGGFGGGGSFGGGGGGSDW